MQAERKCKLNDWNIVSRTHRSVGYLYSRSLCSSWVCHSPFRLWLGYATARLAWIRSSRPIGLHAASLRKLHQMHQRLSTIPWQIFSWFSAFGREIDRPQSDSFLFSISESVMSPCCVLWSWFRSESDFFEPPSHPEKVQKPISGFTACCQRCNRPCVTMVPQVVTHRW